MILPDHQIVSWAAAGGLVPFDPSLVGPASVNVRIGTVLIVESPSGETYEVDISECSQSNPFVVGPGEWLLAYAEELVDLPRDIAGEVCLRSSAGRRGWQHALACFIDPGYGPGNITFELKNMRQYARLPIYPGLELMQLKLSRLASPSLSGYSGRYQYDRGVCGNKDLSLQ